MNFFERHETAKSHLELSIVDANTEIEFLVGLEGIGDALLVGPVAVLEGVVHHLASTPEACNI